MTPARVVALTVRTAAVLALLPAALVVLAAQNASADAVIGDGAVEGGLPTGLAGPVGIAAIVLGLGGLIAGLIRHRLNATRRPAMQIAVTQPAPSTSAASLPQQTTHDRAA